jgi:hypothetical protein
MGTVSVAVSWQAVVVVDDAESSDAKEVIVAGT